MTTLEHVVTSIYPAAARLLPVKMHTPAAWALVTAIGIHESRFLFRRQVAAFDGTGAPQYGPARGWWQFELGGVRDVLTSGRTRVEAGVVLDALGYPADPHEIHLALQHNDVLAAAFARLLVWNDARRLPDQNHAVDGWLIYLAQWRPGAADKRAQDWTAEFTAGWNTIG